MRCAFWTTFSKSVRVLEEFRTRVLFMLPGAWRTGEQDALSVWDDFIQISEGLGSMGHRKENLP